MSSRVLPLDTKLLTPAPLTNVLIAWVQVALSGVIIAIVVQEGLKQGSNVGREVSGKQAMKGNVGNI